jgi:hypothetical protein
MSLQMRPYRLRSIVHFAFESHRGGGREEEKAWNG